METTADQQCVIKTENLSKSYHNKQHGIITAVESINLHIPAGQVFGFLGANGAGKTTTIKMICGLVTPTTGRVWINGFDIVKQRSQAMRQIGAVLEGTRNIYWRLSAWDNLLYFGRLKGFFGQHIKDNAERLLRELELWDRRHDPTRTFSRGMQQKVAIACSLITDPAIVLLDEPTLGLDVQAAIKVKEWIKALAQEKHKTIILTTHQLDIAQDLCDHIAIMRKGRLLADKPLSELLQLFRQSYYQIQLNTLLTRQQEMFFQDIYISTEDRHTILTVNAAESQSLYSLLDIIRAQQLPLLQITQVEPRLEDVFVQLMSDEKRSEEHHELHSAGHL